MSSLVVGTGRYGIGTAVGHGDLEGGGGVGTHGFRVLKCF